MKMRGENENERRKWIKIGFDFDELMCILLLISYERFKIIM